MILAGQIVRNSTPGAVRLEYGWLRLKDHLIAESGTGTCPHQVDLGDENTLISPGFVDAHVHLPQFDLIGAHGLPLMDWLSQVVFPAEARWEDPDFASTMIERVYRQFLAVGTTSFVAFATVHHAPALAAMDIAEKFGFRCAIGQVLMDREAPDYLIRPAAQLARETAQLLRRRAGVPGSRVSGAIAPRFAVSCSQGLLAETGRLAAQFDVLVETHLSETKDDCELVRKLFPSNNSYTSVYEQFGILTPRTVFGHCIWLSEEERASLARAGSVVAHCPVANTFLRAGTFDLGAARQSRLRMAIGSDIGAGYERSMVHVAKAAIETANFRGAHVPTPQEIWWQITSGNATALGWGKSIGTLDAGYEADLCLIRPNIAWRQAKDPLGMVLYAWDDRWLDKVILGGRVM
jgi:guanine deaminase